MGTGTDARLEDWLQFRKDRNAALAQRHGWLTLTSLQWLAASPTPVALVPGLWSASGAGAVLTADQGAGLTLAGTGKPVAGTVTASLADEDSLLWVQYGGPEGDRVVVELARRGGSYAIRTRDSSSPVFTGFDGAATFDYRPDLVLEARFEAYPRPVDVPIRTAHPRVDAVHRTVGELAFRLPGGSRGYRLQVAADGPGRLALNFHDATNRESTAGWRRVSFDAPLPGSSAVTIDFNRARRPGPSAATCSR